MCGLEVFQGQGAGQAALSHQTVDRGEPLRESAVGIAGIEAEAEGRADGRQPRSLDLVGQVEARLRLLLLLPTLLRPLPPWSDMIVHVNADGAGQNLRNPWILRIGLRPEPVRRDQHRDVRTDRSRQKFSPRMTPPHERPPE